MYVKLHTLKDKKVVAICDEDLIGKKFEEKESRLEISERFYKGDKKSKEEVEEILKVAENINIVGEKSIKVALRIKAIEKEDIKNIKKIPYANIITL